MENTIHFLHDNHARFHSDLELMKGAQQETTAQLKTLAENTNAQIQALVESQQTLTDNVEARRFETRDAFNNLIIANETARDLATQMSKLIVNVS